jgi:hypothetical protein
MSSKNTMIKRCSFATEVSVQQAFFEGYQRGVSKTRVFDTAQSLMSRVCKLYGLVRLITVRPKERVRCPLMVLFM